MLMSFLRPENRYIEIISVCAEFTPPVPRTRQTCAHVFMATMKYKRSRTGVCFAERLLFGSFVRGFLTACSYSRFPGLAVGSLLVARLRVPGVLPLVVLLVLRGVRGICLLCVTLGSGGWVC